MGHVHLRRLVVVFEFKARPTYADANSLVGAPWLFRVALTLLVNCKAHFMESRNITAADALDYLFRPPLQILLGDPDAFIAAALAIKVKEDDLRKQRPKVEAALKATQNVRPRAAVVSKDLRTISGPTSAT